MRCLALAQAWQDAGGLASFAMAEVTQAIDQRLSEENMRVFRIQDTPGSDEDSKQFRTLARDTRPAWVVVDGYKFGERYERDLKNAGLRVLVVDDNGRTGAYAADVVLNQNLHARESLYSVRETYTRLLLGPRYALLRREFTSAMAERTIPTAGTKVLVSMGGSDPENVTLRVLAAIELVEIKLEITVVVGGSNPHFDSVAASAAKSRHHVQVRRNVGNMHELMSWAELAISAAGSVCWEYCAVGPPALLVTVAENQIANARALMTARAAAVLGGGASFAVAEMAQVVTRLMTSAGDRRALSEVARKLVDGRGTKRVLAVLAATAS